MACKGGSLRRLRNTSPSTYPLALVIGQPFCSASTTDFSLNATTGMTSLPFVPPFSWEHIQRALLQLSVFRVVLSAHVGVSGMLPAHPHPTARAAEVAAVPPDQRVVAALGAFHALHLRRRPRGGRAQHAHGLHRVAFLVEDAEHGVAVDDEPRDVRHGRRPVLLFARTGCERHKVTER